MQSMPYQLPWYDARESEYYDPTDRLGLFYVAQDYTLALALDLPHNRLAEDLVAKVVRTEDPALAERVRWDSEMGCFFAYTATAADMERLAGIVSELVALKYPAAVPGTIVDSPAFIRNWDALLDE